MKLLVDLGNSRLKWGLMPATQLLENTVNSIAWQTQWSQLVQQWQALSCVPDEVWIASVASQQLQQKLQQLCQNLWSIKPQFVETEAQHGLLSNGYQQPQQLGVDRWLAMIGAQQQDGDNNLCVVDCGTAVTIDIIEKNQHQGGLILPGLYSLHPLLIDKTSRVLSPDKPLALKSGKIVAQDTQTAVSLGAIRMITATIEHTIQSFNPLRCFITGGDAATILPWLSIASEHQPHLVLRGLANKVNKQCA